MCSKLHRMLLKYKDDVESDKLQAGMHYLITQMIRNKEKMTISGDEDSSTTDYLGLLLKAHHDNDGNYKLSIQDVLGPRTRFHKHKNNLQQAHTLTHSKSQEQEQEHKIYSGSV
ncbi:hypothetical protein Hanom_Chr08g00695651 [Helianthus anomalus]